EASFRDREETVIEELCGRTGFVLATGGGAVTRPNNRERLKAGGTVVYLHARPETLYQRVRHSRHRPMLKAPNPLLRLQDLYAIRDPLYREVADHVIESDRDTVIRFLRTVQ